MKGLRQKLFGTRRRKAVAAILTLVLVGGSAFAAWTIIAASVNAGKGGLGTLQAPTISAATTGPADLMPNSSAFTGSVSLRVTNPNAGTLYLKSIGMMDLAADPTYTVSGGVNPPGCTKTILKPFLSAQAVNLATGILVNGSGTAGGVTDVVIPNVIKAADATPNDCQGASLALLPIPTATFSTAP